MPTKRSPLPRKAVAKKRSSAYADAVAHDVDEPEARDPGERHQPEPEQDGVVP
jgi:hypothetical protein